jgi:hypothetical protein
MAFELANGRTMECYADPKHEAKLDRWVHLAATYDGLERKTLRRW